MKFQVKQKVALVILDGWGVAPDGPDNAVSMAKTPIMDALMREYPTTQIEASGLAVGLPKGQMGNSEVGHLNLGAGRIVKQDLVLIDEAVEDGSFAHNPAFIEAVEKIKARGGRAHILGLCSPGGVHSSLEHLYALVDVTHGAGLTTYVHALTDGRDTPPRSAAGYFEKIEKNISGKAKISVVVGRFFCMDRDNRWDRVEKAYMAHVAGVGQRHDSVKEAVAAAYQAGENDEFITPRIIDPDGVIKDGDGVFVFNFRADRVREITQALAFDTFGGFERQVQKELSSYVCMTEYRADFGLPVAFPPSSMDGILGQVLADAGVPQLRTAETEKYAHVTFFFNGGEETPVAGEQRRLVASPKEVATYDLKPQMSAIPVCDEVVTAMESGDFPFVLVNFANGDMVGHTGVMEAAIQAAQTVDAQIARIIEVARKQGYALLITADHGNLEQMKDPITGEPHTAHTNNPVPVILVDDQKKNEALSSGGALRDIAPTILDLLGISQPSEMTGTSLIEK